MFSAQPRNLNRKKTSFTVYGNMCAYYFMSDYIQLKVTQIVHVKRKIHLILVMGDPRGVVESVSS